MDHATPLPISPGRLSAIDFTRGLVIVIMALDHVRDLLHTTSLSQDPVDLSSTTPALFMTRWITHFCAPVFVFLAGTSAYLMSRQQQSHSKTRSFLLSRGLWLVLLEITVIDFGIWWDIRFHTFLFQVIFAIGTGFVILSGLIKLPAKVIGALGLGIILLHDALPVLSFPNNKATEFLWTVLFQRGFFNLSAGRALMVAYPVIPWLGIMLLGFGCGKLFELPPEKRRKMLLVSGGGALLLFLLFRFFNLYGDPSPWAPQVSPVYSFLSFIKVSKYPPSLMYIAITLSGMFFVLAAADGKNNHLTRFFITYGRVPMFFYILHWYIVHISMFVMLFLQGVTWQQISFGVMSFGRPAEGVGVELPYVYLYWIFLVLFMYPLCHWYGNYKAANRHKKWLAYL